MERPRARAIPRHESGRVRVTEWRFAPGEATGWHRHELPYVVVPLTAGTLALHAADGETRAELAPGAAYERPAGIEHDVVNESDHEVAFVEVELFPPS